MMLYENINNDMTEALQENGVLDDHHYVEYYDVSVEGNSASMMFHAYSHDDENKCVLITIPMNIINKIIFRQPVNSLSEVQISYYENAA